MRRAKGAVAKEGDELNHEPDSQVGGRTNAVRHPHYSFRRHRRKRSLRVFPARMDISSLWQEFHHIVGSHL